MRRKRSVFSDKFRELKKYLELSHAGSISRRYFVMNSFDGVMTSLGVTLGSFFSGIRDPRFVLAAGVGAAIAMFFSGFMGTLMTERAERTRKLKELEKSLLRELNNTLQERAEVVASFFSAAIDGISPLLTSVFVLLPFMMSLWGIIDEFFAFYLSFSFAFVTLFLLGTVLGKISRENILVYGGEMLIAGLAVVLISMLLGLL